MLIFKKGFTLIELLAVISIIAVLSTISYAQYQKYVRQGRQLEAKSNLSVVYQKQMSYLSSELKFSGSLKLIGAVPTGPLRYNVGTDWHNPTPPLPYLPAESSFNNTGGTEASNLCPCSSVNPPTSPTIKCWMNPSPESKTGSCASGQPKCYRPSSGASIHDQVIAVAGAGSSNILPNGFDLNSNQFEYYAIGCTSSRLRQDSQLDVWSINHRKGLKNIKSGLNL